ncbi:MAG TPA: DoxX family protein [Thermoanaerobaculia bacterium]|nr:DoxX family protein [Thermoanaerobaculia bacterium]
MGTTQARTEAVLENLERPEAPPRWRLATRIAFRFCFLYFAAYVAVTQLLPTIVPIPRVDVPDPGTFPPVRPAVAWVAKHVFGVRAALVVTGSGSGDKIFDWTEVACLLALAAVGAALWSVLDRARPSYPGLYRWTRILLRLAIGSTFILYGLDKVIPLQMPYPYLTRLLQPYGNSSPMGVLWSFIGASPAYEILVGCVEAIGGILILMPRTALLGTLICLGNAVQVFALNMTYDVPVKLFSFHLIVFAVFLLMADAGRLWRFFVLDRDTGASRRPERPRTARGRRIASVVPAVYVVYLVGVNLYGGAAAWKEYGGGSPQSPLYGIWEVEQMTLDGTPHPAAFGDPDCWRRVVFQFPESAAFQHMDDTFENYKASIALADRKLALTRFDDALWKASFQIDQPGPNRLVLDGEMNHRKMRLQLRLVDHTKFRLVSSGFHWIQEYPFNR